MPNNIDSQIWRMCVSNVADSIISSPTDILYITEGLIPSSANWRSWNTD